MAKTLKQLRRGVRRVVTRPVEFRRTIAHYDRRLPPVLSTPSMIGQMEVAAALLIHPYLPKGAITVGTHINVSHLAPATVGERVRVTAVFAKVYSPNKAGRARYVFEVEARVGKRLLGAGTVERAVVEHRFSRRAQPKRSKR
ncbi:MAG: thioesterase family protein [Terriglobia bacterium]